MAKMTMLDMVQNILNEMDSDEVNSINDTIEALQVAEIIRTCYLEFMANRNWAHKKKLITFEGVGDLERPTHMLIAHNVKEVVKVSYDSVQGGRKSYREVKYLTPEDFIEKSNGRNSDASNIEVSKSIGTNVEFLVYNDRSPSYYTSFDDKYAVFDSYDSEEDQTLKSAKSQVWAVMSADIEIEDDVIPDLPEEAFPGLLAEAKSTCFVALKQEFNQKVEAKARRQQRWLSRNGMRVDQGLRRPDYGRRGSRGSRFSRNWRK